MDPLRNYLGSLVNQKACELLFEPNNRLRLVGSDIKQDLTPFELTGAQISTLIFPIIPTTERQMLPSLSEVRFEYAEPNVGEFDFLVKKSPSGFIVTVRNKDGEPITKEEPAPQIEENPQPPTLDEKPQTQTNGFNSQTNNIVAPIQQVSDFPFSVPASKQPQSTNRPLSVNPFMHSIKQSSPGSQTSSQTPKQPEPQNFFTPSTPETPTSFFAPSLPKESLEQNSPTSFSSPEELEEVVEILSESFTPSIDNSQTTSDEDFFFSNTNSNTQPQPSADAPFNGNMLDELNLDLNDVVSKLTNGVKTQPAKEEPEPTSTEKTEAKNNVFEAFYNSLNLSVTVEDEPADYVAAQTEDTAIAQMKNLFHQMIKTGGSDLHVCVEMSPMVRKDGRMTLLMPLQTPWEKEKAEMLLTSLMSDENKEEFALKHTTDFVYEMPGLARFRANVFTDRKGCGGVFRFIPYKTTAVEELGLPQSVLNLCHQTKGLILVTGPSGSGKSTTLSALIDYINCTREDHIITIEDPIEFVHESKRCLINQREVRTHTDSFSEGLRAALREDPDVLFASEMRDVETISTALEASEKGHLVFGSLHTVTSVSTIDRIIEQFPAERQAQIRVMLADNLRGVISQTLLRKKGGGLTAAFEVLIITQPISNLIREGKTFQIQQSMQTGKGIGMIFLNDALLELVQKGIVEPEEAYAKSSDKMIFEALLKRNKILLKV
jgi:twitching motility protein PilT